MRIGVVGCGYLGATHAAGMAEMGYRVRAVEPEPDKRGLLAAGEVPFYEPHLQDLLKKHTLSGGLTFTASHREVAENSDVIFICVGTPQVDESGAADLDQLWSALESIIPFLRDGALIVGKSTVPVGTAARVRDRVTDSLKAGVYADVAWNPEFLREGHAVADTLEPDRLVFGSESEAAFSILRRVYHRQIAAGTPVVETGLATAEIVKGSANAFLATKISFINGIAAMCEVVGADVADVARALGYDDRIGTKFLNAGIGFGGGCLPKDIRSLAHRAGELGVGELVALLREVDAINVRRRNHVLSLADRIMGGVAGRRVAVLGAAFKPDSDDVRDSPALYIAGQLQLQGASVSVFDPAAMLTAEKMYPTIRYAKNVDDACDRADLTLHLTEWPEFREIDPARLARTVSATSIIDGRNCLPKSRWLDAGWKFWSLGRP